MTQKIITKEEVEKVARLSRINLSKEENEDMTSQLGAALEYFDVLQEINTSDVDVDCEYQESNEYLRDDELKEKSEDEKERIRKNFSSRKDDYLKVKAVF